MYVCFACVKPLPVATTHPPAYVNDVIFLWRRYQATWVVSALMLSQTEPEDQLMKQVTSPFSRLDRQPGDVMNMITAGRRPNTRRGSDHINVANVMQM